MPEPEEGKETKHPLTTVQMTDAKKAKFLPAHDQVGGGSKSFFFELCADALILKHEAGEQIDWPPRFITQDEVLLLNAINTLSEDEVILLKSLLQLLREKSKKTGTKSKRKTG